MKINLSSNLINIILSRLSKVSNTPFLDLALIYKKYSKDSLQTAVIIANISGNSKRLSMDIFKILPFFIDIIKRINYWPIAYITKSKYFYEYEFKIKKGVLIPRPESEILVDAGILFSIIKIKREIQKFEKIKNLTLYDLISKQIGYDMKMEYGILSIGYDILLNLKEKLIEELKDGILCEEYKYEIQNRYKNGSDKIQFCEFCSGSAAISISLIRQLLDFNLKSNCFCFDISRKANLIAKKNAKIILGKEDSSINIIKSNILKENFLLKLSNMQNRIFDFILANPPYIDKKDFANLPLEVKNHEPKIALVPKERQNIFYEKIINYSSLLLKENGFIAFEVSDTKHADSIAKKLYEKGYWALIVYDFQNIGRVVIGQKG